jgi:hypothetical protein
MCYIGDIKINTHRNVTRCFNKRKVGKCQNTTMVSSSQIQVTPRRGKAAHDTDEKPEPAAA